MASMYSTPFSPLSYPAYTPLSVVPRKSPDARQSYLDHYPPSATRSEIKSTVRRPPASLYGGSASRENAPIMGPSNYVSALDHHKTSFGYTRTYGETTEAPNLRVRSLAQECTDLLSLLERPSEEEIIDVESPNHAAITPQEEEEEEEDEDRDAEREVPLRHSAYDDLIREVEKLCDRYETSAPNYAAQGLLESQPRSAEDRAPPSLHKAVCLAPFEASHDVTPLAVVSALTPAADWLTTVVLRWFLYMLECRTNQLQSIKDFETAAGLRNESSVKVLEELGKVKLSVDHLVSTVSDATCEKDRQGQKQLCLHVSNILAEAMGNEESVIAGLLNDLAETASREMDDTYRKELKTSAALLSKLNDENTFLRGELSSTKKELHQAKRKEEKSRMASNDLTKHYERVAADNAELLARVQELEEQQRRAPVRESSSHVDAAKNAELESVREEYNLLHAQLQRQTAHIRELQADMEDATRCVDTYRRTIEQLRLSIRRHRTVIDLFTRQPDYRDGNRIGPTAEQIDDILTGSYDDDLSETITF